MALRLLYFKTFYVSYEQHIFRVWFHSFRDSLLIGEFNLFINILVWYWYFYMILSYILCIFLIFLFSLFSFLLDKVIFCWFNAYTNAIFPLGWLFLTYSYLFTHHYFFRIIDTCIISVIRNILYSLPCIFGLQSFMCIMSIIYLYINRVYFLFISFIWS